MRAVTRYVLTGTSADTNDLVVSTLTDQDLTALELYTEDTDAAKSMKFKQGAAGVACPLVVGSPAGSFNGYAEPIAPGTSLRITSAATLRLVASGAGIVYRLVAHYITRPS